MKSILTGKTILIVEDYPVMRKAIRDMLYTVGADVIIEAHDGGSALAAMARQTIDIILCDYDLGKGKNGQQVLEEARYRNLIDHRSIFIIVTAEQTQAMVLGAMDGKPDEYLTKPFNAQQLYVRIKRNLERKAYFQIIEREIRLGRYPQAIMQCDKLLSQHNPKMRMPLLRRRAELALMMDDNATARQIYQKVLMERDLSWAYIGLGIVALNEGQIQEAVDLFSNVIRENPLCMEAYDWLAKAYEKNGTLTEAEMTLQRAVDLSPQSILRQRKLADIADKNGHVDVALEAYKAAVALGEYSIYKSSSDYSNLANLYHKTKATDEALKTLNRMRHAYVNDLEAELRALVLETEIYKALGDDESANAALKKSLELNSHLGHRVPKELQLDLIRTYFLHDASHHADTLLEKMIKSHIDDDNFIDAVRKMQSSLGMENRSEKLIQSTKKAMVSANNRAVALYKQGQYHEAMTLLEQAMAAMPDNKTIIMNILKIIIHDLKTADVSKEKIMRAQELLKKARQLGVERRKLAALEHEYARWLQQRKGRLPS